MTKLKCSEQWHPAEFEGMQVGSLRHFHIEHYNRYDHRKRAVAECFKPVFAHRELLLSQDF